MVTQILESARLERGRVDFRSEPLQLAGAVQHVLAHLEERIRGAHAEVTSRIPAELYVVSDPLALDVVVRNILENALAALAGSGGRVQLTARAENGEVELEVRDSGVGSPPPTARACSRSSPACIPAGAAATTAPASGCSSCGA